jgi:hypothetical protein
MIPSGNSLVDIHEGDRDFHYPKSPVCGYCNDSGFISSIHDWIIAAKESKWLDKERWAYGYPNNKVKNDWHLAKQHCLDILIDGFTSCPNCE